MVEDQADALSVLRKTLEMGGHEAVVAQGGEEAAELYRQSQPINLLISDMMMPGTMQGHDLAVHLRQSDPALPVIFLSGYAPETGPQRAGTEHEAYEACVTALSCSKRSALPAGLSWGAMSPCNAVAT